MSAVESEPAGGAHFSRNQARRLVGRSVRCTARYSYLPRGTFGKIVEATAVDGGYDLVVEWWVPGRGEFRDWFSPAELEDFLVVS